MAPATCHAAASRPGRNWARRAGVAYATAREAAGPLTPAIPKRESSAEGCVVRYQQPQHVERLNVMCTQIAGIAR